ncbi:MAG: hypothetical protein WDZ35_09470 [Crocinitomicaceae bacterium]
MVYLLSFLPEKRLHHLIVSIPLFPNILKSFLSASLCFGKFVHLKMRTLFFYIVLSALFFPAYGQEKQEKEMRISPEDVPEKALEFIDSLHLDNKIKWYFEEDLNSVSIEAKTKHKKKRYSIEFDTLGNIQDVEIQLSWEELPETTQNTICAYLSAVFSDFRIKKIQLHYEGSVQALIDQLKSNKPVDGVIIKYEIVLKGKEEDRFWKWYEYTFLENGKHEKRSLIIFRNTDNLEY